MKKLTITLLAISFFAINIATAQNTEKKQAIQKAEKKAILKKAELQKISEVKTQTNEAESISSEKLVFTDVKDYEKCRVSYPDFPKYIKTDNEKKDLENFDKAVSEWAKNNPGEFKKIIKEQYGNQQIRKTK